MRATGWVHSCVLAQWFSWDLSDWKSWIEVETAGVWSCYGFLLVIWSWCSGLKLVRDINWKSPRSCHLSRYALAWGIFSHCPFFSCIDLIVNYFISSNFTLVTLCSWTLSYLSNKIDHHTRLIYIRIRYTIGRFSLIIWSCFPCFITSLKIHFALKMVILPQSFYIWA